MYRLRHIGKWLLLFIAVIFLGADVVAPLLGSLLPENRIVLVVGALAASVAAALGGWDWLWDHWLSGRRKSVLPAAAPISHNRYLTDLIERLSAEQDQYVPLAGDQAPYEGYNADYSTGSQTSFVREYQNIGEALAAEGHRRFVIIGEPGAGKTTTLRMLALAVAQAHTQTGEARDPAIRALYGDDREPPLPLWVELGWQDNPPQAEYMLQTWWRKRSNLAGSITEDMRHGRVWLFLDGLNEMPKQEASRQDRAKDLRRLLETDEYRKLRVVVTCRERDYTGDMRLGLPVVRVRPLDNPRIVAFARYRLKSLADSFMNALDENPDLRELGRNPYTLVYLTEVYNEGNPLPATDGELHEEYICKRYNDEKEYNRVCLSINQLKKKLEKLAFRMIEGGKGTIADESWAQWQVGRQALEDAFQMNVLVTDCQTNLVRFYHQSLHQHFAFPGLNRRLGTGDPARQIEFIRQIADLGEGARPALEKLVELAKTSSNNSVVAAALLALSQIDEDVFKRTWEELKYVIPPLPPKERAVWAQELAPKDNRPGIGITRDGLPNIEWCPIPSVKNWHMQTASGDMGNYDIAPFHIGKYPITYVQFRTFLDDKNGWSETKWWKGVSAPAEHRGVHGEQRFKYANHPCECVSWWDAMAFCAWLSDRLNRPTLYDWLMSMGRDLKSYPGVRLPTEWEWQWAAQGSDGFEYSYGNEFDETKCNVAKTGINQTSAVGIFPEGALPFGVLDMCGNVWEWCLNDIGTGLVLYGDAGRVLRGGSWVDDRDYARATCRVKFWPGLRFPRFGFRVCMSHFSTTPAKIIRVP